MLNSLITSAINKIEFNSINPINKYKTTLKKLGLKGIHKIKLQRIVKPVEILKRRAVWEQNININKRASKIPPRNVKKQVLMLIDIKVE